MAHAASANRQNRYHGLMGRPAGDLALRVCGSEYDGRVLRIRSAKCTIGSGEACTLRLQARGIEPLHCLIVRGVHGSVVRRWSRHTRLNGATFIDSLLKVGDRLGIGPLELEVVAGTPDAEDASSPSAADLARLSIMNERMATLDSQLEAHTRTLAIELQRREELEREVQIQTQQAAEFQAALELAEQRLANTISHDELRRREEEWCAERDSLRRQVEAARHAAADSAASEEVASLTREWEVEKARLEALASQAREEARQAEERAAQWRQDADDRSSAEAVDEPSRTLRERIEELESELHDARQAFDSRLGELKAELEAASQDRLAAQDQLAKASSQLEVALSPEAFSEHVAEWEQQVAERQRELEEAQAEFNAERSRFEEELADLRRQLLDNEARLASQAATLASHADAAATWERQAGEGERQIAELQSRLNEAIESHAADRIALEQRLQQAQDAQRIAEQHAAQVEHDAAAQLVTKEAESEGQTGELQLEQLRKELDETRRNHDEDRQRQAAEMTALQQDLQVKEAELEAQAEQIQQTLIELEERQAALQQERERLAALENDLTQRAAALDDSPSSPSENPPQFDVSSTMIVPPPSADPQTDATEYNPTVALPFRQDHDASNPPPAATEQTGAAAVLAKMGYAPLMDDKEETSVALNSPTASAHVTSPFASSAPPSTTQAGQPSEEDDSIEDYMAKLLQRVRGDDTTSSYRPAPAAPTLSATRPGPSPKPATTKTSVPAPNLASILGGPTDAGEGEAPKISSDEYLPRSHAPEGASRLAAMRDLANTSARSAIDRHTKTQWLGLTLTKFFLALAAAVAAVLLCLWGASRPWLAYAGAGLSVISGAVWLVQSLNYLKHFLRARRDSNQPGVAKESGVDH